MKLKFYQVDAFTNTLFRGNYAGVIVTNEDLSDELMQNIATENNLSETAFSKNIENNIYEIRWFSPMTEIDFCGHATLASAFILFMENEDLQEIVFRAKAIGELVVSKEDDGLIKMRFPNQEPKIVENIPTALLEALPIKPKEILVNRQAYFVVYEDEKEVYDIKPDLEKIKTLKPLDVVVTAPSKDYDFVSRYFWPGNGGDEDPVTGSIHTGLAPYWAKKLNKNTLNAFQASSRGGHLKCLVKEDEVTLLGEAVLYLEGYINV